MPSQYAGSQAPGSPQPPSESSVKPTRKVRRQQPQKSVDEFWDKFTTKYPGKVHTILPADIYAKTKASKADKGIIAGHVTGRSYEQAASECKHAVEKIAKECRRVNHKYRDPHFDIEFDLKGNIRDCLDGLQYIPPNDICRPRSVKRIPDIFKKPEFIQEGATASDVRQGHSGDCWFLSALCAISNKKNLIDNLCVARDEQVGVYGFVFHRDGEWIQTIVDDKLYLIASDWWEGSDGDKRTFAEVNRSNAEDKYREATQTGSKALYFAQCMSENETWLPLLEKAFAKAHGDYSAIDGGFTGEAIEDLTGGVTTDLLSTDILDRDKFWSEEIMKVNEEFLFSCSTGRFDKWQDSSAVSEYGARDNIFRLHAYSILEAREIKGQKLLRVRNPWGQAEWRGAWSDGSEQWTPEWMQLLDHRFGDDGMFWISYDDILKEFSSFDRTRLFGREWNITQQWTTVDVPWSADYYNTKFIITVTKRSPCVIVLSQLDERYFRGLQGQYTFQLHFRLEKDGEHDYIVRSHGNYSMRRSVSTDLELDPGRYSVLMKIMAKRFPGEDDPEDAIRENVRVRQNKLIQVGLAYDLAHAKGQIRETEVEKGERLAREEKKKAAERKIQRKAIRKQKLKEWEFNKRLRAREKRHANKKEEYQRKKAEARKESEGHKDTGSDDVDVSGDASAVAGVDGKVEKEATAPPSQDMTCEAVVEPAPMPSLPTKVEVKEDKSSNEDAAKEPASDSQKEESKIPSVKINGGPSLPAPESDDGSAARPSSHLGPDDDYQYDSDASFQSSIDSVLDFPHDNEQPVPLDDLPPTPPAAAGDGDNAEFENDPWNAVCVVGLKVYSKGEGCCVEVVRPKQEDGDEEDTPLDLDDASKGASGEIEGGNKVEI